MSQTKLANVVFTLGLHDRLQVAGSLCTAPDVAATNLQMPRSCCRGPTEAQLSDLAGAGNGKSAAQSFTDRARMVLLCSGPALPTRRRRRRRRRRQVTTQGLGGMGVVYAELRTRNLQIKRSRKLNTYLFNYLLKKTPGAWSLL